MNTRNPRDKKATLFIMIIILIGTVFFIGKAIIQKQSEISRRENIQVVFDAMKYINFTDNKANFSTTIDVERAMGEPETKEDWTYEGPNGDFLLTTYTYNEGKYEFIFCLTDLLRITINDDFAFTEKDDIPYMFGLKEYKNTYANDTGYAIRYSNTGIHDLWILGIEGNTFDTAKITYASGVFD